LLIDTCIDKGLKEDHKSIPLLQEAHNLVSFSLYAKLGFESKDQVNFFMGRCLADWPEPKLDLVIREMTGDDISSCDDLHKRIVGVSRAVALSDCLSSQWAASYDPPMVVVDQRTHRIVGYATSIKSGGHGVGENDEVVARLHYVMTQRAQPAGRRMDDLLLKIIGRQCPTLVRWALNQAGLKLQRNMTLMAMGQYTDPIGGIYMPSIMY
jgi:hypothetical protein